jgi:hypothetical protein
MGRALLAVLAHLFGATVAAAAAIVLALVIFYVAYPWFQYLLSAAGVSWAARQRIAASILRPELFIIVPTAVALLAYLVAFACCKTLTRRSKRPLV